MNWQAVKLGVGTGLAGLVVLALVAPDLLGIDAGRAAVVAASVLALLQAAALANARRHAEFDRERTPDPERRFPATPPGESLSEALQQFYQEPHAFYRMSGRAGLRVAAVAALTRYEGLSHEQASERVEAGTWTEDPAATAFLQTDASAASLPRTLGHWLRPGTRRRGDLERCIDAIAEIAGAPPPEDRPDADRSTDQREAAVNTDESSRLSRRETERWRGISVVVLAAVGIGVILEEPALLLVGVVGLAYAAYARSHDPEPVSLSVERSLDERSPAPGQAVEVTVRLTNDGEQLLPDVRVVDGVPASLTVASGSPRHGTALRPGESAEWRYTVTAERGVHEFDPALVLVRNAPGTVELAYGVGPDRPTRLACTPPLREPPTPVALRGANSQYAGRQPTASRGDGTEFFATRRYQHGDDIGRIDWNRRAKTGELATVLFRQEQTATVVLVVDTDPESYVAPEPGGEHAVDRAVDAARDAYASLADQGHFVGIASLTDPSCWLAPGAGPSHRAKARELLAVHPALDATPTPEKERELPQRARRTLRHRIPAGSQVVFISPLCRRTVVRFIRQLEARGHAVTVLSPDATADRTPGQRLAQVGRRVTITDLRRDGIPVLDWNWDEPLAVALARFEGVATR